MTDNSETPGQVLFEELEINLDEVSFEQLIHYTAVEYFLTIEIDHYLDAQEHLKAAFNIFKELNDNSAIAEIQAAWAKLHYKLSNFDQTINESNQGLVRAQSIGDRSVEAQCRHNLGKAYQELQQYSKSQKNLEVALEIFRQIEQVADEATVLASLAKLYYKLSIYKIAHSYCNQALDIATELDIPLVQECQELKDKLLNKAV